MPIRIIEIDGGGITVYDDNHRILLESPACATVDAKQLLLGDEARAKARLNPTGTNTYFWDRLAMDALAKPFLNARHHADIAYWHLRHIWEQIKADCDEVVIALPGSFNNTQLGLVLGITQSLEIPVKGMIDAALAASDASASQAPIQLHLDIQLHRSTLTRLALNSELRRIGIKQLVGTGFMTLYQIWSHAIRDDFLRLTRFDPLLQAQTEQQLYTSLQTGLLRLVQQETLALALSFRGKRYSVTLNRGDLSRGALATYDQILSSIDVKDRNDDSVEIHLSHRIWALPGFTETITEAGIGNRIVKLDSNAVAKTATRHYALIGEYTQPLHFITLLPRPVLDKSTGEQGIAQDTPTHILYRSQAYPISERPLTLGSETIPHSASLQLRGPLNGVSRRHCSIYARENQIWLEDHSTYGTFVNEQKSKRLTALHTGDKVRIGTPGEVLLLIAEVNPHAT